MLHCGKFVAQQSIRGQYLLKVFDLTVNCCQFRCWFHSCAVSFMFFFIFHYHFLRSWDIQQAHTNQLHTFIHTSLTGWEGTSLRSTNVLQPLKASHELKTSTETVTLYFWNFISSPWTSKIKKTKWSKIQYKLLKINTLNIFFYQFLTQGKKHWAKTKSQWLMTLLSPLCF